MDMTPMWLILCLVGGVALLGIFVTALIVLFVVMSRKKPGPPTDGA